MTGLEREKIDAEHRDLIKDIARFKAILENPAMVLKIVRDETKEIQERYGDERRTEVIEEEGEISVEDLIADAMLQPTITITGDVFGANVLLATAETVLWKIRNKLFGVSVMRPGKVEL